MPLFKKWLNLLLQLWLQNVTSTQWQSDTFVTIFRCWRELKREPVYSRETTTWSTQNNIRPNRNNNHPVLILTMDGDLGDGRTIKMIVFFDFSKNDKAFDL
jgi:hypothetical protein